MTPEEKGNELINKFYGLRAWELMDAKDRKVVYGIAKESAILCTEHIIKAVDDFDNELYEHEGVRMSGHKEYYENVLFYIKNL